MQDIDTDDDDNVDLILDDDPAGAQGPAGAEANPWRILIVDDDVDVHVVTKFALSNTQFQGRRLSYLHAYSGHEALDTLRDTPDIALVLLDVIMETPDAGLRVARQIRDDLHNQLVRIVLRTGQPGQNQETGIILDYDINDFWSKADLTTRKLLTTVIASLRAYGALAAAAAESAALRVQLRQEQQLHSAVDLHTPMLALDARGRITDVSSLLCRALGVQRQHLLGHDLHVLHQGRFPQPLADQVAAALAGAGTWSGTVALHRADGSALNLRCSVQAFKDGAGAPVAYVALGDSAGLR